MINKQYKFWFATGSQDLYGDECLREVADHSKIIVENLNKSNKLPFEVILKPTLIDNKSIRELFNAANADENCAGVICQADNLLYEQDKYFIYSNQWIPLTEQCTIQEKCRLGSLFDAKCGGGCIAHIDIENRFPTKDAAWDMLNYVASSGVIYFAFTTKISVCEDKHAFIGSQHCPRCGKPVADQYARVVGFYTPVSSYQKIRKREFNQRKWYNVLNQDSIYG